MPIQTDAILTPNGKILHAAISEDEAVLMSVDVNRYFGLNAVAMRVWELLIEQPRTVADVSSAIHEEFEIDLPTCEADVLAFVSSLVEHGIVHEVVA